LQLNAANQLRVQSGVLYSMQNLGRAEFPGIVIDDPEMTGPFVDAGTDNTGHSGELIFQRMDIFVTEFFVNMNNHIGIE
jgi:hypothetical protein